MRPGERTPPASSASSSAGRGRHPGRRAGGTPLTAPVAAKPVTAKPTRGRRASGRAGATRERTTTQPVAPEPRVRGRLTLRAVVLAAVVLVACVLVIPTLNTYLQQQENLRDLSSQVDAASQELDNLNQQLTQWKDPAYIKAQARGRLGFAMPGETSYRVLDPETVEPDPTASSETDAGMSDPTTPSGKAPPWYVSLWDSTVAAGQAPAQ